MRPVPTPVPALGAPLRSFMQAHGIGTVPIAVMPDNGVRYGFDPSGISLPEPMVRFEREAVVALCAAEEAVRHFSEDFPRDAVLAGSISDRFVSAWSDVRAVLSYADKMHMITSGVRKEKLEDFVNLVEVKYLQHASIAMISEHDASIHYRTGSPERAMESMSVAATAWLNSVRQAGFTGLLGRHLVSRSIFHSCFGNCWHTAELAFVHSSKMYLEAGDTGSAADELIRAALAHARRPQVLDAVVSRHLGGALELLSMSAESAPDKKRGDLIKFLSAVES